MMWLDGDASKTMEKAIQDAMVYYQKKYGVESNRVQIPLDSQEVAMEGILIERDGSVQRNYLLITADREVNGRKTETGEKGGR
jgi:hypothetical protein